MGKKNRKNVDQRKGKTNPSNQARLMGWTLVVILIASIGAILYKAASGPPTSQVVQAEEFQYEKQPMLGSKDAPIKIVEFADFKCPSCKAFDQEILPLLKKDFIDQGIVQFYFINYPIVSPNADSRTAAIVGEAVYNQNPEAFWEFYEEVYSNQQQESLTWATSDFLVQLAKEANLPLDFNKLKEDIDQEAFAEHVNEDMAIGNRVRVNGTPTVFMNGKELSVQDTFNYDALKDLINQELVDSK